MATDEYLLVRILKIPDAHHITWKKKNMFGGNRFMVDNKFGFDAFKRRPLKGYGEPQGYVKIDALDFRITKYLDFNPHLS